MKLTEPIQLEADAEQDTERFARMTPEERLSLFLELCDLTDSVQAGRPNRSALRAPQLPSRAAQDLWLRLMQRHAHG